MSRSWLAFPAGRLSLSLTRIITAFLLLTPQASAIGQTMETIPTKEALDVQERSRQRTSPTVTLKVKDSSVEYVINQLAQQAKLRLFYNNRHPYMTKRISVDLMNEAINSALKKALENTGLYASLTSDGEAIMVRAIADSSKDSLATGQISGVIFDSATSSPLPGVTVQIPQVNLTTITDRRGAFMFSDVPYGQYSLTTRLLGHVSTNQSVSVQSDKPVALRIVLRPAPTSLTEIVTTASGLQRRVEIANDIAKINPEVLMQRTPVRNLVDLLEAAQVPGVLVTRSSGDPGASSRIRIRGIGSISQSNDPIVIVDGIWIDGTGGTPSRIDDIDPATIETLEIVRGPSAATLYGQDASNGVIVITTKRGLAGPTRWNFSYSRDWGDVPGRKPLTYVGWGHSRLSTERMWCPIEKVLDWECIQDSVQVIDPNHRLLIDEAGAVTNRYVLSADGGTNAVRYSLTGTVQEEMGARRTAPADLIRMRLLNFTPTGKFLKPSHLARRNLAANFTMSPSQKLDLMLVLTGNQNNMRDNRFANQYHGISAAGSNDRGLSTDTVNFLRGNNTITESARANQSFNGIVSFQANWRPLPWGQIGANTGFERVSAERSDQLFGVSCPVDRGCNSISGQRTETQETRSVYTVRFQASGRPSLGRFERFLEVRPALGMDYRKNSNSLISFKRVNIPPGERNMSGGEVENATYSRYNIATAGWYLNSTIGLFRRLYFDVGLRQDIGSAITSSSKARYPKLGTSWLISDESFWPQNNFVNTLRLRGALGHSAVQPDIWDIHGQFRTGYAYVNGQFIRSADLFMIGNNKLQPERATEVEFGFDTDMLDDRLQLGVTMAHSENVNTLIDRSLAPSTGITGPGGGITSRKENIARVFNRSLELAATGRVVENRDMLLVVDYGLTLLENRVKRLGDGVSPFSVNDNLRVVEGYPVAGLWSRSIVGYRDYNGDQLLSPDEIIMSDSIVYIGWSQPRYRASYGASLTLQNSLTLDMRLSYQSKYAQSMSRYSLEGEESINSSLEEQAIATIGSLRRSRPVSDLRFNSASITYQVPAVMLQKLNSRSMSISLQGSNLGLWTNYRGRDPGVNTHQYSEGLADDGRVMPRPRMYVLSFRLGL